MPRRGSLFGLLAAIFAGLSSAQSEWTEMYVPYGNATLPLGPQYAPYDATNPKRQHLHIMQTPSPTPTPVYIFAHGNGGSADIGRVGLANVGRAGYSFISWESVTTVQGETDFKVCEADLQLVRAWILDNAATYNLNPDKVVIGGRSRGSLVSWSMAQSLDPAIWGIYMYNALPDSAWAGGNDAWLQLVTPQSPPIYLTYGPECPKPIAQDCLPSPDPTDGHNPKNGQKVMDRYGEVGVQAGLTDGLTNRNEDVFLYFADFVATLTGDNGGGESPVPTPESSGASTPRPSGATPTAMILACGAGLVLEVL